MKLRIASILALAAVAAGCTTEQARPECLVGRGSGSYVFQYTLVDGACAGQPDIELVGIQKYDPLGSTEPGQIAIMPSSISAGFSQPFDADTVALGDLDARVPGTDDFCRVPTLSAATGGGFTYTFSDVAFYTVARAPGTQVMGNVHVEGPGCDANYTFTGVYPWTDCTGDEAVCPTADSDGHPDPFHVKMNPDFVSTCNTAGENVYGSHVCVIDTVPSLKARAQ